MYIAEEPVCAEPKLFAGGLRFDVDRDAVYNVFSPFGSVKQVVLLKHRESGKSKGCAMVLYEKWAHAEQAILSLNGTMELCAPRKMIVKFADPQPRDDGVLVGVTPKKLFVGQVPSNCNKDFIQNMFQQYGAVTDINVMQPKKDGAMGCAFVTFNTWAEAEQAIESLNGNYVFPGASNATTVKFADAKPTELQRAGTKRAAADMMAGGGGSNKRPFMGMLGGAGGAMGKQGMGPGGINPMAMMNAMGGMGGMGGISGMGGMDMSNMGAMGGMGGGMGHSMSDMMGMMMQFMQMQGMNPMAAMAGMNAMGMGPGMGGNNGMGTGFGNQANAGGGFGPGGGGNMMGGMAGQQPQMMGMQQQQQPGGQMVSGRGGGVRPGGASQQEVNAAKDWKLFIGQLSYGTAEQDLIAYFCSFGNILEAAVLRGSDGRSKGCAFLSFSSREEAERALSANGGPLPNDPRQRPITVKFADAK